MVEIPSAAARYEYAVRCARTSAALQAKRARGEQVSSTPPYGWAHVDGRRVSVPSEQDTIAVIMSLRDGGRGYGSIAKALDAGGYPCRGSRWHAASIRRIVMAATDVEDLQIPTGDSVNRDKKWRKSCERFCLYCKMPIGPKGHEHDHFPVPERSGGTDTYCVCLGCHTLKDRTLLLDISADYLHKEWATIWETMTPFQRILLAKVYTMVCSAGEILAQGGATLDAMNGRPTDSNGGQ